jgi:hypothetical protein
MTHSFGWHHRPQTVLREHKTKTYARRVVRIVLWVLAGIPGVIILALLALQVPGIQSYIAQKAVSSLSGKTHTRIEVGSVSIAFTHTLVLRDLFVEDRQGDTLLSVQTLAADVNLLGLFSHAVIFHNLRIDSLTAHVTRTLPDSSFNFGFILKALGPASTADIRPDTSAVSAWEIRPEGISLNGIRVTYDDEVNGLNLRLQIGSLESSIDKFNLDRMQIHLAKVFLENTSASVIQTKVPPRAASQSTDVDIGFRALSLANVQVSYENRITGDHYGADVGKSTVIAEKIDLPAHHITLKEFLLENTHSVIVESRKNGKTIDNGDAPAQPWVISLDNLSLSGNSAQYDVQGAPRTRGLDPNHVRLDGLAMHADNLFFSDDLITANLVHTSFREHSGLDMREFSGGFTLDSLHARFADFTVETAASRIRQNILLEYSSIAALKTLRGDMIVNARIDDSHVAISDLLLFQPFLPIKDKKGATIRFSCQISGRVGDLRLEDCRIATGDSTTVDLTGSIRGLPEPATAHYDIDLREFSSGRSDIRALVADTGLPGNLVLPAAVRMNGEFKGGRKEFFASVFITTSIGDAKVKATLRSGRGQNAGSSQWKAEVSVEDFNLGSLLDDPETFGPVSLDASAEGTGLSRSDIEAELNVEVDKAVVNGYAYRRFSLLGNVRPNMFEGKAEIQDSNIVFAFNGTVNTGEEKPTYKFRFDLKGADLQRLRLTPDDLRVSGVITSDLTGRNLNDINGTVEARNVVILKNRNRYVIDSLLFASVNKEKKTRISIESALLAATFEGTIALDDLPAALEEHFGRYFTLHNSPPAKASSAQAFTFRIDVRDPRMFTEVFFPQFDRLAAGAIQGQYNSEKKDLNLNVDIPRVGYGGFDMDSVRLNVTSDPERLQATLRVGSVSDSMLLLSDLQLSASVEHDSIAAALRSTGSNGAIKMLLAGSCTSVPNGYQWRFSPGGIVFLNTAWDVPADNAILFGAGQFMAHDVVLLGDGQSLSLNSTEGNTRQPPLTVTFAGFDLATLSRIVERDSGLVRGVLDGNLVLQNHDKQRAFTSDVKVSDFAFARRAVGDIALRASNQTENIYSVSLDITGNDNDIAARGEYRSKEGGSELNLKCDLKKVNLASIEPLTFGAVRRLSGTANGELDVTGTITKPFITGNLAINNTAFEAAILGSYLRINEGRMIFDGKGVHFGSFEILDTLGNKASLSGNVFTSDFRNLSYDFHVSTTKFLLMNKPASRDALYYGTVFLDSDISVVGDAAKPIIRMQAQLDKGTDLAFVLPESETDVQQRSGIVRFLDVRNPSNPIMSRRKPPTGSARDTTGTRHSSIDLTANVEVNKESRLRILIDPIAGDSLVIRGEATFSVGVDPSGKLAVTGRFEIIDGSYQLSFGQFIRREFTIAKGSSLTWFGAVTDANVDITAIYTVKTSALDLVQDQLVGLSQEERNKYKQALRIQVYLTMDGKLLAPNIHFRLDMPLEGRGVLGGSVYAKLNEINGQESELNKQVFALLVLGRFLSSNPLASASDGGLTGLARSSVSQILTEQLNRLSEKVIPGVGLNVGVESYQDYSTGAAEGRTQLQLALTKQLFDERVTVQVGGNADLEGPRSQQNALNNFAGDIKVAYKMTEDGRWLLQVFRQNTNGGAIEGDLVETGVGIAFTIDYDRLFGFTLTPVSVKAEER